MKRGGEIVRFHFRLKPILQSTATSQRDLVLKEQKTFGADHISPLNGPEMPSMVYSVLGRLPEGQFRQASLLVQFCPCLTQLLSEFWSTVSKTEKETRKKKKKKQK